MPSPWPTVKHDHALLQVVNPKKDLPVGLLGSLGVVTTLYMLMSATIVLMVPYTDISPKAAFAAAFQAGSTFLPYPHQSLVLQRL